MAAADFYTKIRFHLDHKQEPGAIIIIQRGVFCRHIQTNQPEVDFKLCFEIVVKQSVCCLAIPDLQMSMNECILPFIPIKNVPTMKNDHWQYINVIAEQCLKPGRMPPSVNSSAPCKRAE